MAKRTRKPKQVESLRHKDKRANIPTEELRGFVEADEEAPPKMLYPRDPSLDPQLVWKGKDEQDREPLEVPVVPVYIQEKIQPQAIVEDISRLGARQAPPTEQPDLFADFNGLEEDFEKKVDFYSQKDDRQKHWANRMILGDSLLVMTSLAEKEGLKGKVQMIYFDPPYGIKFGSNWQVSTRKRDVKDGKVEDATRQPEQVKAFRDTWELGIHSYLAYLRDRLVVARDLLTETGSVFVQIGDENVHLVRSLLDEIFGAEKFYAQINYRSMTALGQDGMASVYDYILWYSKKREQAKFRSLFAARPLTDEPEFCFVADEKGAYRKLTPDEIAALPTSEHFRVFKRSELRSSGFTPSCTYGFKLQGKEYVPSAGKSWRTHADGMAKLIAAHRLIVLGANPYFRQYYNDFSAMQIENSWHDTAAGYSNTKVYVVQTADRIIQRCLLMTTDPGDLVLDPTCGSGTTAYVAEQWRRRWITTDTSRVALTLARTRLMSARYPYHLLADSEEGKKKEAEITGRIPPPHKTENDIRWGFVYKRVPHITLKSIANNPDIKEGMTREATDAAIARHADTETLYDRPYPDNSRVRVSGPFTVESLFPHRTLPSDEPDQNLRESAKSADDFFQTILDNLRSAGVQNTFKNERLKFDRLDPLAGAWLQAEGSYTDADGKSRRVAVSIGPEHGTVGPNQIKEAAKEAVQGIPYDVLIIAGFAFDSHVSEETKRYGKLTVLPTRINNDLMMGPDLLKKTGSGNLFMVFGEPDVDVRKHDDGKIVVEIHGLDVYDPTTGEVRSNSTDDIACWFIDTDYDQESFFVRHAYFTGADEPYDKLKRALRAEIDEAAWSELYSTTSQPFDPPEKGKIAVKVINHYGDEVLKVYTIANT